MNRGFLLGNSTLGIIGIGFGVLGYHVHTLNNGPVLITVNRQTLPFCPLYSPVLTITWSPFLICNFFCIGLII